MRERHKLFAEMQANTFVSLFCLVGDWNDATPDIEDAVSVAPAEPTFRQSATEPYTSHLDAAAVSALLARHPTSRVLSHNSAAQHRPVEFCLSTRAAIHDFRRWIKKTR